MKVFIIGINGFIGNALAKKILSSTDWGVIGIDIDMDRLSDDLLKNHRFEFNLGDITINKEWVEFQIKRSDVIIPLAAIAIPKIYIENPLLVFELDFLENLRIIKLVAQYNKRVIFPSTSEVYGMCTDEFFDEETSNFIVGPINKHRWIYSSCKQLLDRVIHAYGLEQDLHYTLFRPFNWIGPHLDRIDAQKIGNSRVLTQFIASVVLNREIILVDGGIQKRCFLYIDDGIEALIRIIKNEKNVANKKIFNIGNPDNEISIKDLADLVVRIYNQSPRSQTHPFTAGIQSKRSDFFYGEGYEDVDSRKPSINAINNTLGWKPKTGLEDSVRLTLQSFLEEENE